MCRWRRIAAFEQGLLSHMHAEHGDWMADINATGAYDEAIEQHMRSAIEAFKAGGAW